MNNKLLLTAVWCLVVGSVLWYGVGVYQNQEIETFDTQSYVGTKTTDDGWVQALDSKQKCKTTCADAHLKCINWAGGAENKEGIATCESAYSMCLKGCDNTKSKTTTQQVVPTSTNTLR